MERSLDRYLHGGYVSNKESENYIDFSANIVPEMPERVKQAAIASIEEANHYPDPQYRRLRKAIAGKHGVQPEQVVCGNGAGDLIYKIAQVFGKKQDFNDSEEGRKAALIIEPAFTEYERALLQNGIEVIHYSTREDEFRLTERFFTDLEEKHKKPDIIFLAQPANPTGLLTDEGLLLRLGDYCEEKDILLVTDESFYELTVKGEKLWLGEEDDRGNVSQNKNARKRLLILNSFTKLYGMAGLRLGYLIGYDTELLDKIDRIGQPWSISAPAIAAGIAAMGFYEEEYRRPLTKYIAEERERMKIALEEAGFTVYPGEANYLFFYSERKDLYEKLLEKRIVIRDCSNYYGLSKGYYRVAILKKEENDHLIQVILEIQM